MTAQEHCEFCGGPLETLDAGLDRGHRLRERVTLSCHRCGKKFEAEKGSRSFCLACELTLTPDNSSVPQPSPWALGSLRAAASWGVALPITVRTTWAVVTGGRPQSPESRHLAGLLSCVVGAGVLSVIA